LTPLFINIGAFEIIVSLSNKFPLNIGYLVSFISDINYQVAECFQLEDELRLNFKTDLDIEMVRTEIGSQI
jgi:hypothetical protein